MTVLRLLAFPTHAALEFAGGLALMVAPFALGFSPAGMVVTVVAGVLIAGFALSAASGDGRVLNVAGHLAFDRTFALCLVAGALVLSARGDADAAIALLTGSLGLLALTLTTRYSGSH